MTYGVFINYKHTHKHLAGRIYDFFVTKGAGPFMDDYAMNQDRDYRERLLHEVRNAPYFLCLLTEDALEELCTLNDSSDNEENIYFEEIKTAFESARKILVLTYGNIDYEVLGKLPKSISGIRYINHYKIPEENRPFYNVMEELHSRDIDYEILKDVVSWREIIKRKANTWLTSRGKLENDIASLNERFGRELVECVKRHDDFTGNSCIKEINMVCYAATIIINTDVAHIDRRAYDYGTMFNIFAQLLKEERFIFRLVVNAPLSVASKDAVNYSKLGNHAMMDNEEAVFLNTYANINKMIESGPYKTASTERRFTFTVTECVLPYAMFQIVYDEENSEKNHIKVDLYSCNMDSSADRRTMVIFRREDQENYDFFENQIKFFNSREMRRRSFELISQNHDRWMQAWTEYSNSESVRIF